METMWSKLGQFFAYTVAVALLMLVFAWPTMWTWNYTMPYLFGLPELTWGRAWCLAYVVGVLIHPHHYGGK